MAFGSSPPTPSANTAHREELKRKLGEREAERRRACTPLPPASTDDKRKADAEATAARLGHQLTSPWLRVGGDLLARCIRCNGLAKISDRAGLSGPALMMGCTKK